MLYNLIFVSVCHILSRIVSHFEGSYFGMPVIFLSNWLLALYLALLLCDSLCKWSYAVVNGTFSIRILLQIVLFLLKLVSILLQIVGAHYISRWFLLCSTYSVAICNYSLSNNIYSVCKVYLLKMVPILL